MDGKVIVSWSGGKDGCLALHEVLAAGGCEVVSLLTTFTSEYDRSSIHGVRRVLVERQAESLGLPLEEVFISKDITDGEYAETMGEVMERYASEGVSSVVFGDIFLGDVRRRREDNLSKAGMRGLFPLWGRDTAEVARAFIAAGFRAVTACVDSKFLDSSYAGRQFDGEFLSDLPSTADPCGENGEFHSFAYDGPIFREPVPYSLGEVVFRENRFYYCDLLPP